MLSILEYPAFGNEAVVDFPQYFAEFLERAEGFVCEYMLFGHAGKCCIISPAIFVSG
jgi:hypothetical protein